MSRILHITLKKKWFDMELSGEKPEEYRELKKHWLVRLVEFGGKVEQKQIDDILCAMRNNPNIEEVMEHFNLKFKQYDIVHAVHGYGDHRPSFDAEFLSIEVRTGRPEWGAVEGEVYFVTKLGKILAKRNVEK